MEDVNLKELVMKGLNQNLRTCVTIGREHWDVPVRVELRPYLDFNRHINLQLKHLVARWADKAAPAARKFHIFQRRKL